MMVAMSESLAARMVRHGVYPLLVFGSLAAAHHSIAAGVAPEVVAAATPIALMPIVLALELTCPETPRWRLDAREVLTDVLHMVLSNSIPMALLRALLFGATAALSDSISAAIGTDLWPLAAPLWAQALLVIAVAELANYWIHRGYHESRLWPLHAVHHCSPRMYFLLSMRKHPLQSLLTYGGRLLPLWLLGAPAGAIAIYTALISANSILQHANVRMTTGRLGLVLATPELHRLHHSRDVAEHNSNYGDSLIVWDRLFRTHRVPEPARPLHEQIGLPAIEVRQTYWQHLAMPFVWRRLHEQQRSTGSN
jgi:sterol desaturase/sphingolipid hydroxylase (fatty acid hydroxylase superfamily)